MRGCVRKALVEGSGRGTAAGLDKHREFLLFRMRFDL